MRPMMRWSSAFAAAPTSRTSPVSGSYSSRGAVGAPFPRPGARTVFGGCCAFHGSALFFCCTGFGVFGFCDLSGGGGFTSGSGLPCGSFSRPRGASANAPPVRTCTVPSSTRSKRISRSSVYSCLRAPSSSASAVSLMPGVTRRDRVSMTACRSSVDIRFLLSECVQVTGVSGHVDGAVACDRGSRVEVSAQGQEPRQRPVGRDGVEMFVFGTDEDGAVRGDAGRGDDLVGRRDLPLHLAGARDRIEST